MRVALSGAVSVGRGQKRGFGLRVLAAGDPFVARGSGKEAEGAPADEAKPVDLRGREECCSCVTLPGHRQRHHVEGDVGVPAVGVVEVGEEKDSEDEESDQHKSSIDFMKESVLLLVLSQK